jgi:hypothetical protein
VEGIARARGRPPRGFARPHCLVHGHYHEKSNFFMLKCENMDRLRLYSDRCVPGWLAGQSPPWYVRICSKIRISANRSHNNQNLESDWPKRTFQYYSYIATYISFLSYNGTKRNLCVRYLVVHYEIYIVLYKYFAEIYTIHAIYPFIG